MKIVFEDMVPEERLPMNIENDRKRPLRRRSRVRLMAYAPETRLFHAL